MKLLSFNLPDNHNIFFGGDYHDGSQLSCRKGWEVLVDMLLCSYGGCRNNYLAEGGDDIECICIDDKRYSTEMLKGPDGKAEPLPLVQMQNAIQDRQKIKKKILYKLTGNHERKLWKFGDITEAICRALGVPYGTYTTKTTINDLNGNYMYKIYDTHGHKSITSTADDPKRRRTNMELILKRHLKFKAADCAVMIKHHAHKLLVCKPDSELYLTDDGKQIQQNYTSWGQTESYIHPDARWYGCAGSFLRLFGENASGYAEIAEYDPVELGFLVLMVRDKKIVELRPVYLNI